MSKLPSIALIHGWATEPTIWDPVREKLELKGHVVTAYAMPGYGSRQHENGNVTFDRLVADAIEKLQHHDLWVGWSLGAMVALQAAREKAPYKGIFAVCPTAKFCCDSTKAAALDQLRASIESDAEKAVARFRRSMPSSENRRKIGKQLKELEALASSKTLHAGLEMLATTDLTDELKKVNIPVKIVSGESDPIIPCSSGEELHRQIANSTYTTLPCGHVPFLECPQRFMEQLFEFTQTISGASADSKPV